MKTPIVAETCSAQAVVAAAVPVAAAHQAENLLRTGKTAAAAVLLATNARSQYFESTSGFCLELHTPAARQCHSRARQKFAAGEEHTHCDD